VRAVPSFPRATVESMLASLPRAANLGEERSLSGATRNAIAATVLAAHRQRADLLLMRAAGSAVVVGVLTTIWTRMSLALWMLPSFGLLVAARLTFRRRRTRRHEANLAACRADVQFNETDYRRIVCGCDIALPRGIRS
jgi:hypothetical protein